MRRQKFRAPRTAKGKSFKSSSRTKIGLRDDELIRTWTRRFPFLNRLLARLPISNRSAHKMAGRELRLAHQEMMGANDSSKIWRHFERVHILTQHSATAHTAIHILMFVYALYRREWQESIGQIPRIALAAPSSLFKFAPPGNSGRIAMKLSQAGPIPSDLQAYLTASSDSKS